MISIEKLEISISYGLKILIYPKTKNSKCFYEAEAKFFGESVWQLQEGQEYEYEFIDDDGNPAKYYFTNENNIVIPNKYKKHRGTIRTGTYVGTIELYICDDKQQKEYILELEIQSIKTDYRTDYRIMLEDITKHYIDIIMSYNSILYQKIESNDEIDSNSIYQKFAFVKSFIESDIFHESIQKILQNPTEKCKEIYRINRIENTRRLGRSEIRQIISKSDRISFSDIEGLTSISRKIINTNKQNSINSYENQFVKYVLILFYNFCSRISKKIREAEKLAKDADGICNILQHYLNMPFFKEVEEIRIININNSILQRKDAYREILQAWLLFDISARLNWNGGNNVYKSGKKNVAILYEYWIFFKLLEIISQVFNISSESKYSLVEISNNKFNLNIKQGQTKVIYGIDNIEKRKFNIAFYYNRTFAYNNNTCKEGSWTLPMRPDYTLSFWPCDISEEIAEKENKIVHIHFDAKYRVQHTYLEELKNEKGDNDSNSISDKLLNGKKEQEFGLYKRTDILKMHVYKDSIRRTIGAYIIYPGNESYIRKEYNEILPGIGAFCISPGKYDNKISEFKDFLLNIKNYILNYISKQ